LEFAKNRFNSPKDGWMNIETGKQSNKVPAGLGEIWKASFVKHSTDPEFLDAVVASGMERSAAMDLLAHELFINSGKLESLDSLVATPEPIISKPADLIAKLKGWERNSLDGLATERAAVVKEFFVQVEGADTNGAGLHQTIWSDDNARKTLLSDVESKILFDLSKPLVEADLRQAARSKFVDDAIAKRANGRKLSLNEEETMREIVERDPATHKALEELVVSMKFQEEVVAKTKKQAEDLKTCTVGSAH